MTMYYMTMAATALAVSGIDGFAPASALRGPTKLCSYLDSLSGGAQAAAPSNGGSFAPMPEQSTSTPPPPPSPPTSSENAENTLDFAYANADYFGLDKLVSKGPRATKDWGEPQDASRKLADDGVFRVGSWWCSEGGWPSPNGKAHTEVFYMLEGHGCLEDADGMQHWFGPGDTVIIPKGHTGRWDVHEGIHKVWAVNDHPFVEETSPVIRVQVIHYKDYITAEPTSSNTFYDVGPTSVGVSTVDTGSYVFRNTPKKSWYYILEGIFFLSSEDGQSRRCIAGDTVMLPKGWSGTLDVVEPVKKIFTTAD